MIWRTRIILYSEATLEIGKYKLRESEIIISEIKEEDFENPDRYGQNHRLVDVILPMENGDDIRSIFARSRDILDEFIDRICLIGYSSAGLFDFISVCPLNVEVGEEFEIAVQHVLMDRELNVIDLASLFSIKEFPEDSGVKQALRFFRNGFTTNSDEEKLLMYYTALERLAEEEATDTVKKKCAASCKEEYDTGQKATAIWIRVLLKKYNIDEDESQEIRSLRAKIAHGAGRRNVEYLEKVNVAASRIETVAINELSQRLEATVRNRNNVIVAGLPTLIHRCIAKVDGSFTTIESKWIAKMQFPVIPNLDKSSNRAMAGCATDQEGKPILPPSIAWPKIIIEK